MPRPGCLQIAQRIPIPKLLSKSTKFSFDGKSHMRAVLVEVGEVAAEFMLWWSWWFWRIAGIPSVASFIMYAYFGNSYIGGA